jgi:4-aminobutyrate aminotransferase/(S)-3-amino-2-methylpropionate transaminase
MAIANGKKRSLCHEISMATEVPGPKSRKLLEEYAHIGAGGGAVAMFLDLEKSDGCYIADADGNLMLDLFQQIASLPLGYNHPALKAAHQDPLMQTYSISRPALGLLPPKEWPEILQESFMAIAPKGLTKVQTMLCGSSANENAFKAAFFAFREEERKKAGVNRMGFTQLEHESCMDNKAPGCANHLSIMSFKGGFHGRTLAALTCTHSKSIHKLDVPSFDWPTADFPDLKYPLDQNKEANAAEEKRCLEMVNHIFEERQACFKPVAGIIVEPVLSEGGDFHASPHFFQGLQNACQKFGAAFIVDEVQSGVGASGKMWAHEDWGLEEAPDFVCFSKKALLGGYYYKDKYQPPGGYRIFNTWMGDPCKALLFRAVVKTIQEEGLLDRVKSCGEKLRGILDRAAKEAPDYVSNVRNQGCLAAFDSKSPALRDKLHQTLRNNGVLLGVNGSQTMRFRPPLILEHEHLDQFEKIFFDTLHKLKA